MKSRLNGSLERVLDRFVAFRARTRARLGLRPTKPWWMRPNAHETSSQVRDQLTDVAALDHRADERVCSCRSL